MVGKSIWPGLGAMVLVMGMASCASDSPRDLPRPNDHAVLAAWYAHEAACLREKAAEMQQLAEWYAAAKLSVPPQRELKVYPDRPWLDMERHCRALVQEYSKAAEEAEALAEAHADQMGRQ